MKYPIGVQDFESLRKSGYLYIDKTDLVHHLAENGKYYFLGRPRRFGKSLLVSTFEAYFKGKRELFEDLKIEKLEKDWNVHPVLHLDLNSGDYTDPANLDNQLNLALLQWERLYGRGQDENRPNERFMGIVRRAFEKSGMPVVILVDEYDKPMLQALGNESLQDGYRRTLKAFYSVLKTQDRYIRFAFLTGATKFGKISVFSDLNNLDDISMDDRYVRLCGLTESEIHEYLEDEIPRLALRNNMDYDSACAKLRDDYDGYHFCRDSIGIYNPFSVLNTFNKLSFNDYWFETGTPSFLVGLLRQTDYNLNNLTEEVQTADMLNSIDTMSRNPIPTIYQSGYLTIKGYDDRFKYYRLGFPNKEVETGFTKYLLPYYTPHNDHPSEFFINKFVYDIEHGDPDAFMSRLQELFAGGDYQVMGRIELYFQNTMWVIFRVMGFYTEVEKRTSTGRIDLVLKTPGYIYVMEIKRDGSASDALRQINDKGYAAPFASDGRKVYKIGVNFSSETKGITEWIVE